MSKKDDYDNNNKWRWWRWNQYQWLFCNIIKGIFLVLCSYRTFFSLPLFLKKEFCKGSCDPLLNRSYRLNPCWCWWTVPIIFACSPCIAMSLLSLNYSICIDFLFVFGRNHVLVARPRPSRWRGRDRARLYRFMRFLLVFWELYSNTFQVCIEKHSSHLSHVDLERCISSPSAFSVETQRKEKKLYNYLHHFWFPPSFFNSFLFLSKWMLLCCFSPSSLVNGCSFMWDVRAGKPIECSVYIKSHSFHDYNLELFGFDCSSSHKSVACFVIYCTITPWT